jgi:hypothetical protein
MPVFKGRYHIWNAVCYIRQENGEALLHEGANKIVRTMKFRQRLKNVSTEDFETASRRYERFPNMDIVRNEEKQNPGHLLSEIVRRKTDESEYRS